MKKSLLLATALLGSTALAAPALAQDGGPVYSLSATGGVSAIGVPSFDTGVFGHTASGTMFGFDFGAGLGATLTQVGGWDLILGANVYGTIGTGGGGSWTDTFTSADSSVLITGTSTPTGSSSITHTIGGGPDATIAATGAGGATADIPITSGATNNVAAVSPDGSGFVMSSATSSATTAAAYTGIGASSGGVFLATGNIDGLTVSTTVSRSFAYGGADLTLGLGNRLDGSTSVQVYAGPSFRGLREGITTDISVDIPEVQPSVLTHPMYKISVGDTLVSTYLGGLVGGKFSVEAQPGVTFTLGLEGGIYSVHANYTGQDTYSTCCGAVSTPLATSSPTISVKGPSNSVDIGSDIAFSAKGSGAVSWDIAENKTLSLGGNVEYLSRVAQVNHGGLTQTGAPNTWTPGSSAAPTTTFSWGSMIKWGVSGTFTGHF